jgi:putative tryptophan/tyrosine transport system substrate-binding protein
MAIGIGRRQFISALGGAAVVWPLAARAQQPTLPVVGFLHVESSDVYKSMVNAFHQGLEEIGYVEGRNVTIEYRWAENQTDRLPAMAADLIYQQVAVIAALSTPAALAAKAATTTVPIVFETGGDPVQLGLVASLSQPGGNATGVSQLTTGLVPKQLEMLHELLPKAHVMVLLVNPAHPATSDIESQEALSAARALGLDLHVVNASSEADFDKIFANLAEFRSGGLVIAADPLFSGRSEQLAALAARHAVPAVYKGREFAAAGGLMSYGTSLKDSYRLAGIYVGRTLKGEKPADLPVQQATKVELYINLKTAKTLGITFPLTLLGRADEVME